jgi:hypothetical protein
MARYDGVSNVQRWVAAVAAEFNKYLAWPVKSLRLDDVYVAFQEREARDKCALTWALDVAANGTVQGVVVTSAAAPGAAGVPASCTGWLLTAGGASAGSPREVSASVTAGGSASAAVSGLAWKATAA